MTPRTPLRLRPLFPAGLAVALGFAAQAVPARSVLLREWSPWPEGWAGPYLAWAALWILAWGALALALRRLPREPGSRPPGSPKASARRGLRRRTEVIVILLILAAGTGLRLHRLDSLPPGVNTDACWSGAWAEAICTGIPYSPIFPLWEGESAFNYVMAAAVCTGGNTSLSLRIPSAIFSILGLVAFFFMARALLGPRAALWGTALMALAGGSWLLGRSGWRASTVLLVEPLVLWTAYLAWSRKGRLHFALLGAALAASLNAYGAARILPPALLALLGARILAAFRRDRAEARRLLQGSLVTLAVFLTLASPVIHYALTETADYNGRFEGLHQGWDLEQLAENLINLPVVFFKDARGDDYFTHHPVLEPPLAVLAGLGLAWALARAGSPPAALLLWVMAWGAVPSLLTYPNWNHLILWLVPLVALAGAALAFLQEIVRRTPAAPAFLAGMLAVLLLGAQGRAFWSTYLGPHRRPVPGVSAELLEVGTALRPFARNHVIASPLDAFDEGALTYLTWPGGVNPKGPGRAAYLVVGHPYELLRTEPPPGRGIAFVIPAGRRFEVLSLKVRRRYPGHGEPVEVRSRAPGRPLLCTVIPVGPEAVAASRDGRPRGLVGTYWASSDWSGPPVRVRRDPEIHSGLLDPTVHSAVWRGRIVVEEPGGTYEFATDSDDGSWLVIDGTLVVDNGGEHGGRIRSGTVELAPGEHELVLRWNDFGGGQILRLLWKPPDMGELVPVPSESLLPAED